MVARELPFAVRHEGQLVQRQSTSTHFARHVHQVVKRIALDVVLALGPGLQHLGQIEHIVQPDVSLVGARMHGDPPRAGLQAQRGRPRDRRDAQVPGVAHQGHLVEVDRKRCAPGMEMRGHGHDDGVGNAE
ncbi:hypothetical protein D9M68_850380 [compost metagenome]